MGSPENILVVNPSVKVEELLPVSQRIHQGSMKEAIGRTIRSNFIPGSIREALNIALRLDDGKSRVSLAVRAVDIYHWFAFHNLHSLAGLYVNRRRFSRVIKLCHYGERFAVLKYQVRNLGRNPGSLIQLKYVDLLSGGDQGSIQNQESPKGYDSPNKGYPIEAIRKLILSNPVTILFGIFLLFVGAWLNGHGYGLGELAHFGVWLVSVCVFVFGGLLVLRVVVPILSQILIPQ